jgi:hypothetical protein
MNFNYIWYLTSLFIIGQCPLNVNIPKIGALQISPPKQNGDFLDNSSNDFDYILVIYGGHLHK